MPCRTWCRECTYGRILCLHATDGTAGLGEIVFAPALEEAQRVTTVAAEPEYLGALAGRDLEAVAGFARDLRRGGLRWHGVAFGLETACLDCQRRREGRSLADLLGGAMSEAVDGYFSISEQSAERVRQRLAIAGPACRVIQLKLGVGTPTLDAELVATTLAAMAAHQVLLADVNGGWSLPDALAMVAKFDDPRLVWEEPCAAYEDNLEVARCTPNELLLDGESSRELDVARRAIERGGAAATCIKPALIGGLDLARELRDRCIAAGMKMRIDGPWCGDIASAAILELAIGAPPELLIAGCDLREPLLLEPALDGVVNVGESRIRARDDGLDPDEVRRRLGEPEAVYRA